MRLWAGLLVAAISCVLLGAPALGDDNPYGLTNPKALGALQHFKAAEASAKTDYDRTAQKARAVLLADLQAALVQVTQAGNLEEAGKIIRVIGDIKQNGQPSTAPADHVETASGDNQPTSGELFGGSRPATGDNAAGNGADALVKALTGVRWKKGNNPNGNNWILTFHDDMSLTRTDNSLHGTWAPVSSATIRLSASENSCSSDVLHLDATGTQLIRENGAVDFVAVGP